MLVTENRTIPSPKFSVNTELLAELERLIKSRGALHVNYDAGGSGMGLYWGANLGHEWPWCHGSTLEGALKDLVMAHNKLGRESAQKRINEIDASASL